MTAEQKDQHRLLVKKHNIHFDGLDGKWPELHRQTFENIQRLGQTEFTQYHESVTIDSEEKPWRQQTRRRAERIAGLAKLCREGRKNEAGWRLSLESEVLARFTIEVACRKCRARLWRSELEVPSSSQDRFMDSLQERQKRRTPCVCRSGSRKEDAHEQGVNLLFDDRAQECIIHEESLQSMMPKKEEPDRVYGLRTTKRLERLLLYTEDKRPSSGGKFIGESLRTSPFRPDGEPVVFPFLVLEAKSEKGRDGFSDIEFQTAFSIRTLLKLQDDLRTAAGDESEWETGPLVWFLANKGEQWRVAAAYIDFESGIQNYRITDLWDGRITSKEGALRLLLIIDYIFDWARDIYREAIIGELQQIASNNAPSLGNDSEIYSLTDDRIAFWTQDEATPPGTSAKAETESAGSSQDLLHLFDSPFGVFRDIKHIRSRFLGLHITEDNLSVLMQSMKTPQKAQDAARTILRCLKDSWRVSRAALDELELGLTGQDRENADLYSPDKIFLVTSTLCTYLSPSWEQTRELSYIAVAENVLDALWEHSRLKNTQEWVPEDFPHVSNNKFVSSFHAFLTSTVEENLMATISRTCMSTKVFSPKTKGSSDEGTWWVPSVEHVEEATKYRFDAARTPDNHAHCREFVSSIYNLFKIGRNEPSSSILRISNRLDDQSKEPRHIEKLWPLLPTHPEKQDFSLVTSKNLSNVTQYAELCVFVTNTSKILETLQWDGFPSELSCPQYQTRRLDSKPGWGRGWNAKDVTSPDESLPEKVNKFLDYIKSSDQQFFGMSAKKAGKQRTAASSSVSKKPGQDWDMVRSANFSFFEALKFRNMLGRDGRRVNSITTRFHKGSNHVDEDPSGPQIVAYEAGPEKPSSSAHETIDLSDDLDAPEQNDNGEGSSSSALRNDPSHRQRAPMSPPDSGSKRRFQEFSEGHNEASSSTPSKRHRIQPSPPSSSAVASSSRTPAQGSLAKPVQGFSEDYLNDEELERLLREGVFAD